MSNADAEDEHGGLEIVTGYISTYRRDRPTLTIIPLRGLTPKMAIFSFLSYLEVEICHEEFIPSANIRCQNEEG